MKNVIFLVFIIALFLFVSCENGSDKNHANTQNSINTDIIKDTFLAKIHLCTEYPKLSDTGILKGGSSAGAIKNLLWPSETKSLKVRFLEGDSMVQKKVMNVSREWEKYCGIHFEYVDTGIADITIGFEKGGSWSCIGKSCLKKIPSMNFGWLTPTTPDEEYYRVVLHEFGHALGMIHEHQNPADNQIHWDSATVYQYYTQSPNFWTKEDVNKNLFAKYAESCINGTAFDSLSIMLYAFPKELTKDGYSTNSNSQLSAMDKIFINTIYPK